MKALGEKYGLGQRRTLEQYNEISGVDTVKHKLTKKCIVDHYVPWDASMKNSVYMEVRERGCAWAYVCGCACPQCMHPD